MTATPGTDPGRQSAALEDLVEQLWLRRRSNRGLAAAKLSPAEGFAVLTELVQRAVAAGDSIVGWKIARIGNEAFLFAAPVFKSSLELAIGAELANPRLEIETVALVDDLSYTDDAISLLALSWHVGFEFVDNHDPDWTFTPGWAIADWGLHVGAALGDRSPIPPVDVPLHIALTIGGVEHSLEGTRRVDDATIMTVLSGDCERFGRKLRVGDLIWTGSLIAPIAYETKDALRATVEGLGSVSFP